MRLNVLFICAILSCSSDARMEKAYFEDGKLKAVLSLRDNKRNGLCTYFYPNGNILSSGEFIDDLKIGRHSEYFIDTDSLVQYEVYYEIDNGREKPVKKVRYNKNGLATYTSILTNRKFTIEELHRPNHIRDSVKILIRIENPVYEYTAAFVGNYDEFLKPLDSIPAQIFNGNEAHEVIISVPFKEKGRNEIRGFIRDFTIKPIDKSIGVTVAEDTYFKYSL